MSTTNILKELRDTTKDASEFLSSIGGVFLQEMSRDEEKLQSMHLCL